MTGGSRRRRTLAAAIVASLLLGGCQTPLHSSAYQSKNNALYNDLLLDNLDRIDEGRPRLFFIGLALWGGERWSGGDILRMQEITARIYPAFRPIPFVFSNEAVTAPADMPSFDPLMLDKTIALVRAKAAPGDLLVIAASSHGAPGRLSNRIGTQNQRPVDAAFLIRRLRRLGDLHTLLMLSACHSGSFAEILEREDFRRVMVVASARSDRTSFGCSPAETSTWFVRALAQASRELATGAQPPGWSAVMERARQIVSEWERNWALDASMPQLWIGKDADRDLFNF